MLSCRETVEKLLPYLECRTYDSTHAHLLGLRSYRFTITLGGVVLYEAVVAILNNNIKHDMPECLIVPWHSRGVTPLLGNYVERARSYKGATGILSAMDAIEETALYKSCYELVTMLVTNSENGDHYETLSKINWGAIPALGITLVQSEGKAYPRFCYPDEI